MGNRWPKIVEADFDVFFLPSVAMVFSEARPPFGSIVAVRSAVRQVRRALDELAGVLVDDRRRRTPPPRGNERPSSFISGATRARDSRPCRARTYGDRGGTRAATLRSGRPNIAYSTETRNTSNGSTSDCSIFASRTDGPWARRNAHSARVNRTAMYIAPAWAPT